MLKENTLPNPCRFAHRHDWPRHAGAIDRDRLQGLTTDQGRAPLVSAHRRTDPRVLGCVRRLDGRGRQGPPRDIAVLVDPDKHTGVDCSPSPDGVAEHVQPLFWSGRHRAVWCVVKGPPIGPVSVGGR